MKNYRSIKKRAFILLTNLAVVMYTLSKGNSQYDILGYMLLILIAVSMIDYWRNC